MRFPAAFRWGVGGLARPRRVIEPLERCTFPLADGTEPGANMAKIPQGEWSAIAARYAQGESISRIAQSYGCTPPAIHYILKRNKTRTLQKSERPLSGRLEPIPTSTGDKLQTPFVSATPRSAEMRREEYGGFRPAPSEVGSPPAPTNQQQASRDHGLAFPTRPTPTEQRSRPSPLPSLSLIHI